MWCEDERSEEKGTLIGYKTVEDEEGKKEKKPFSSVFLMARAVLARTSIQESNYGETCNSNSIQRRTGWNEDGSLGTNNDAYWKFKGGDTYVVENLTTGRPIRLHRKVSLPCLRVLSILMKK